MSEVRKCEICGKSDVRSIVCASGIAPTSFNTCDVCLAVGAEPKSLLDIVSEENGIPKKEMPNFTYYDKETDMYYDYATDEPFYAILEDETKLETRSEMANYLNDPST